MRSSPRGRRRRARLVPRAAHEADAAGCRRADGGDRRGVRPTARGAADSGRRSRLRRRRIAVVHAVRGPLRRPSRLAPYDHGGVCRCRRRRALGAVRTVEGQAADRFEVTDRNGRKLGEPAKNAVIEALTGGVRTGRRGRLLRAAADAQMVLDGDNEAATLVSVRIGVDTGGTSADLVGDDGQVSKCRPRRTTRHCCVALDEAGAGTAAELLAHGTTVATNALLEGGGGRSRSSRRARRRRRDRAAGPALAVRPDGRPAPAAGRSGPWSRSAAGSTGTVARSRPLTLEHPGRAGRRGASRRLLHADLDAAHEQLVAKELTARGSM